MIVLSEDQKQAHDVLVEWRRARSSRLITLGGWAGTGKSTLMGAVTRTWRAQDKKLRVAFCAFTGKAALGLRNKLEADDALREDDGDSCGTIHSLIYAPVLKDQVVVGWRRRDKIDADVVLVDEASMVDAKLFEDLSSYGLPILAVGDHGQLPPVSGALNLMENPDLRLERIHRQAEDNPIIRVSRIIREEGRLPVGRYGEWVRKVEDHDVLERITDVKDLMVICGTNRTRSRLNQVLRRRLDFDGPRPVPGEKLICLKNNREAGVYNGQTGVLRELEDLRAGGADLWYKVAVAMDGPDGNTFRGKVFRPQFGHLETVREWKTPPIHPAAIGDLFDWGYAITAHKAQGSESDRVVVFEECAWMRDEDLQRRWLYTSVSRARQRLLVVGRDE